jgi:hypothetical protein
MVCGAAKAVAVEQHARTTARCITQVEELLRKAEAKLAESYKLPKWASSDEGSGAFRNSWKQHVETLAGVIAALTGDANANDKASPEG